MPTLVELEQLLDIALTTPEIGTVNFNILRVFLQEILKHLNIENKIIDVDNLAGELKSAYDFIKDGYVEIRSPDSRNRTPMSAERPKTVVDSETEPEEQITKEKDEEEGSKSKTPVLVVEERKSDASEKSQESKDSTSPLKPGSGLSAKDQESKDSTPSPMPVPSSLSVKDQLPATRSSVLLFGRSESYRNLKKMVSELQERVESLESQPAPLPDPVRSAASLVRKESRTPAHDFVELINIKRKLEASENSIEGLTEMVDALSSDVNELKEITPNVNTASSDVISEIKKLKNALENQNGEASKQFDKMADNRLKIDGLESMLANLKATMEKLKSGQRQESTGISSGISPDISEALQNLETHDKQIQGLTAAIQVIEVKIEETDAKFSGTDQATSDALVRLEACGVGVDDVSDKLEAMEKGLENHKSLIEDNEMQIHQLKNTMTFLQRESLERANESAQKNKEEEKTAEPTETPAPRRRAYSTDRDELSLIRTMIFDLQEEKDKLKQTDIHLNDELYKKQKHLDDLYNLVDELRDLKADKELLSMGFELKADKREMEGKIGREDFEHYMSLVDQSLRDLLQRLDGHEDALKRALEVLNSDVGKKLDKDEMEPLKHYLEKRMESMRPKPVEKPPEEVFAAGIHKPFLVDQNCISCDRPVKYAQDVTFPPLPTIHSMPGSKSNRPYTTFELEQIRQHMLRGGLAMTKERFELLEKQRMKLQREILRLSGARDLQELAEITARACGGMHTLTYPHSQAVVRGLQLNRDELEFLVPQKESQPVDILGQDGHIYKGLLDSLPPTLPHIPQKSKSPRLKNPPRNFRSSSPTSPNLPAVVDDVESS